MKQKTSAIKVITLVICILLIFTGGVLTLLGGTRALVQGNGRPPGNFDPGEFNEYGVPPSGDFQPGEGDMQPFPPGENGGQGMRPGNIPGGMPRSAMSSTQMKLIILLRYTAGVAVILFGILAAIGIWFEKKWGKVMAVITSVIVLAYTIPNMFTMARGASIFENIFKILLAIALVVLVFLPQKKQRVEVPTQSMS